MLKNKNVLSIMYCMEHKQSDVYAPTFRHYLAIFPLFVLVRLLQSTVRLKTSEEDLKRLSAPERLVGIAWHSRIFFLAMCKYYYRDKIPMTGLVSASRDGAYLCAFFNLMNILTVRGSHKRRGVNAVINLVESIKKGSDVFITPDGPRGPRNKAKAGFAIVAKESGARILALKITPKYYFRINKAWDKFILPLPFSSATVTTLEYTTYADLEKSATEQGKAPEELVSEFLNSDNID